MMKIYLILLFLILMIFIIDKKYLINFLINFLFFLSFLMILNYNNSMNWMKLYNWLSFDIFSFILMFLSIWIVSLMFMVSISVLKKKYFSLNLMILLFFLLLCFNSMNYFNFYLFFEITLFPTFMLIMGWGYQPERLNAGMYMYMYTLFASLPLLILLYYLYNFGFSLNYFFLLMNFKNFEMMNVFLFYFYMMFAFIVKLPMFIFHMWLPKAHLEAPVTGSMILAGIMLKLGGYGIMRSMLMMLSFSIKFNYIYMVISIIGMIYLSLICLRQFDIKLIIAYSSVVHMGMMLIGLLSLKKIGYYGGFLMMIGHGLCSSALFLLINFMYIRFNSRNILLVKGMINFLPSLTFWIFLFLMFNMSAPPSLNLISELLILMVMMSWSFYIFIFLMLGMYLSACYSLYLFSYTQHGEFNFINKIMDINLIDYNNLLMHFIPLNFLILKLFFM
nr:NADH dehydrogenase subunit 4 [Systasis sp. 1 HHL-2023a]